MDDQQNWMAKKTAHGQGPPRTYDDEEWVWGCWF